MNHDFIIFLGSTMGCAFCKGNQSAADVVLVFGNANGIVIKDFRRKGKTIKQIVFVLPEIVVTNENNEQTIVYKPEINQRPKIEHTKIPLWRYTTFLKKKMWYGRILGVVLMWYYLLLYSKFNVFFFIKNM